MSQQKLDQHSGWSLHGYAFLQDRQALAPLQDPPQDDIRLMIEQAIDDMNNATQGHDLETTLGRNLLEARCPIVSPCVQCHGHIWCHVIYDDIIKILL